MSSSRRGKFRRSDVSTGTAAWLSAPLTVLGHEMVIMVPAVGFYTLHAWIWQYNPAGLFAHWNPNVTCP